MAAMTRIARLVLFSTLATAATGVVSPHGLAQAPPSPPAVGEVTTSLGADGTARITRVVPVPTTISPEARAFLATGAAWAPAAGSEEQARLIEKARSLYPVRIEEAVIAGVPVRIVTPPAVPPERADRVLVNLHGGGFVTDSGSMLESIPIASLTRTKVVTVLYRLAPAHKFPAAVDDVIAVYRELLKTNQPRRVVLYGTSAGAILSAQAAVRMRREGLPLPAAIGFFTGFADFANPGDSLAFFGVPGLDGARPRTAAAPTTPSTSATATRATRSCPPSTRTSPAGPPRCASPGPATCSSAAPSTSTGRSWGRVSTPGWWSSTRCPTRTGTWWGSPRRRRPSSSWRGSSTSSSAGRLSP